MFENVPLRTPGKSGDTCQYNQNGVYISQRSKNSIINGFEFCTFRSSLLLQLINLELGKERKKKRKVPQGRNILFYCYSFRTSQIVVVRRAIKPQLLVALDNFKSPLATVQPPSFNPAKLPKTGTMRQKVPTEETHYWVM